MAEYSTELQSAVEFNWCSRSRQECSVFIQANKFLEHSPDDFHGHLGAASFLSSTAAD